MALKKKFARSAQVLKKALHAPSLLYIPFSVRFQVSPTIRNNSWLAHYLSILSLEHLLCTCRTQNIFLFPFVMSLNNVVVASFPCCVHFCIPRTHSVRRPTTRRRHQL